MPHGPCAHTGTGREANARKGLLVRRRRRDEAETPTCVRAGVQSRSKLSGGVSAAPRRRRLTSSSFLAFAYHVRRVAHTWEPPSRSALMPSLARHTWSSPSALAMASLTTSPTERGFAKLVAWASRPAASARSAARPSSKLISWRTSASTTTTRGLRSPERTRRRQWRWRRLCQSPLR